MIRLQKPRSRRPDVARGEVLSFKSSLVTFEGKDGDGGEKKYNIIINYLYLGSDGGSVCHFFLVLG